MSGQHSSQELGQRIQEESRRRREDLQKIINGLQIFAGEQKAHHEKYFPNAFQMENRLRQRDQERASELETLLCEIRDARSACMAARMEAAEKDMAIAALQNERDVQEIPPTVQIGRCCAIVTAERDINMRKVLESKQFEEWVNTIAHEGRIEVSKLHIQSLDVLNSKVIHIKLKAEVTVDGQKVPGILFLSGGAVAILVILSQGERRFALVVRQPRPAVCLSSVFEILAGSCNGEENFAAVAAKEVQEQTGMQVGQTNLIDMTQLAYKERYPGIFPSCGGYGQFKRIFLYQQSITAAERENLMRRFSAAEDGGAVIQPRLIPLESLWRTSPDASALAALTLYDKLSASGLIPKVAPLSSENSSLPGSVLLGERLETLRNTISRLSPSSLKYLEQARSTASEHVATA